MKQKPRWTLEMLTACLAILCVLLMLVLLVQRPAIWPVLVVLAAVLPLEVAVAGTPQLAAYLSRLARR